MLGITLGFQHPKQHKLFNYTGLRNTFAQLIALVTGKKVERVLQKQYNNESLWVFSRYPLKTKLDNLLC